MLDILLQDEYLIAIDKPPGLLVHRSPIDRHETRFAVQLLRDQVGRRVQPVHRLDKGTSGALLFAFDADTTRELSGQFERGEVGKTYLAVVRGWPPVSGLIDHPLTREPDEADAPRMPDTRAPHGDRQSPDSGPQPASTRFRRLATIELPHAVERYPKTRYALLALAPLTGRRHQLRRHLKHIAHPIIGDATHGKGRHNRFFQTHLDCHRLLLACVELRFRHPVTGQDTTVSAPPGEAFSQLMRTFGWAHAWPPAGEPAYC
ncbi:MAG: pseudouridine synthase [Burkholderiales bacterium]|nr:pseudouridine synthase [Burkholderiales bacterium]